MNKQPFHVGDRVIALRDSKWGYFFKGAVYTVMGISSCACGQIINIGDCITAAYQFCSICGMRHGWKGDKAFHNSNLFAHIYPRHSNAIIDERIVEQAQEMVGVKEEAARIALPQEN